MFRRSVRHSEAEDTTKKEKAAQVDLPYHLPTSSKKDYP